MGLGETVMGLINAGKAKSEAARLQASRPKYQESPYYKDALSLSESELSTGMSGAAKNAYEQGLDRDLSTSLSAVLKGGGSVNNVAEVFDKSSQGRQRLAIMKDNLRLNQINNLVRSQQLVSDEREKAFQFNEWAPWADEAKANAAARTAAQGEIMTGINTAGGALMSGLSSAKGAKQLGSFFSSAPPASPTTSGGGPSFTPVERASTTTAPNTGGFQVSPNVRPMEFNLDQSGLPDIQDISALE